MRRRSPPEGCRQTEHGCLSIEAADFNVADLMVDVEAAWVARHAGPAVHLDAFVVQPRHSGSCISTCDQGSGRTDGCPRVALLDGGEESPAVSSRLCLGHILVEPFGSGATVQPCHRAGLLRWLGIRSGAGHEYGEPARLHRSDHLRGIFRQFGEGRQRGVVGL